MTRLENRAQQQAGIMYSGHISLHNVFWVSVICSKSFHDIRQVVYTKEPRNMDPAADEYRTASFPLPYQAEDSLTLALCVLRQSMASKAGQA